jgi:cysteinyl-tRNA synthetase
MNDDFNTAQAIAVLFEQLRPLRKDIEEGNIPSNIEEVKNAVRAIADDVLGIWPEADQQGRSELVNQLVEMLIEFRAEARDNKNFELADSIRDRLADIGVQLKDGPEGTSYEIK